MTRTAAEQNGDKAPGPGPSLLLAVRHGLEKNLKLTLNSWCQSQKPKIVQTTARQALLGASQSKRALVLRARLIRDAGLN